MKTVTYRVDAYAVRVFANDLRGNRTRWAAAEISFYSKNKLVGRAFFARAGYTTPPDSTYAGGIIWYNAAGEQFERVLDLLRNEKPVYIRWQPHVDTGEPNDGNAYVFTSQEPVGEEES